MNNVEQFEQAKRLIADYTATLALLRRCGHSEASAVEAAGVLLADRLAPELKHN